MRFSLILLALGLGCGPVAFAAEEAPDGKPVHIALSQIKKVIETEAGGDELYFSVTEYSSLERPHHYLVPNFPTHWLSDQLTQISHVDLWSKNIKDNESVMVLISLLERDAPPWNVDDLIGTIKYKIRNVNGHVEKEWSIPNKEVTQPVANTQNEFVLTGDQGEYIITLDVQ